MKYKTEWNLGLYYKSDKDRQIEKDMRAIESAFKNFEKKYKGKDFTSTPQKLLQALKASEKVNEIADGFKPIAYFGFKVYLNSDDSAASATSTQLRERFTKAVNKVTFLRLTIAQIPAKKQKQYLSSPLLKRYHYDLKKIFAKGKYYMSEGEEQLANLLSQPSYSMWVNGHNKVLNQKTIDYKGEKMPLSKATSILSDLPKKERQVMRAKIAEVHKSTADFAEAEINAVFTKKKILDDRRGYRKPYSATILSYENDEKAIENLVSTITKNFKISHRFYKLHTKLLGEKKTTYVDKNVKIGEISKKFDFQTSVEIVKKAFAKVDPKYSTILDEYLGNGQIDVYPRKGKRGGAFCANRGLNPTMIFLNHADNIRSLETIAHEMGHAFHTDLSKSQPVHYRDYPTSIAEVASTFFEQVLQNEVEKELSEKEKVVSLHNRIMGDISTIFRQIAAFNFETELHDRVRSAGQVTREEIAGLMKKHMSSYLGPSVEVSQDDGYVFVSWPHIRYFFYVYSYAYGQLISRVLFEKWNQDPRFAGKIEQFLSAGGSRSPEEIFKSIGIDTSNPKFFELGLKSIEKDIDRLEQLTKKVKK